MAVMLSTEGMGMLARWRPITVSNDKCVLNTGWNQVESWEYYHFVYVSPNSEPY